MLNLLFLEVGGYNDILNMGYWDFVSVMRTLTIKKARQQGNPIAHKGISTTQQQMIQKQKGMKHE